MPLNNISNTCSIEQLFISNKYKEFIVECGSICRSLNRKESKRINYDDDLFVIAMNTETRSREKLVFESHRKYIDIHVIVEGEEVIDIIDINDCPHAHEFNENDDYYLYDIDSKDFEEFKLVAGDFKVIFFHDVHKASVAKDGIGVDVKKLVIKISEELFDKEVYNGK